MRQERDPFRNRCGAKTWSGVCMGAFGQSSQGPTACVSVTFFDSLSAFVRVADLVANE